MGNALSVPTCGCGGRIAQFLCRGILCFAVALVLWARMGGGNIVDYRLRRGALFALKGESIQF